MALAAQPDRWAAGVALHPVADFHAMYQSSSPWIQAFVRALVGDPISDAALWRNRSPLTHAARIRAPVLMDAGVNDSRTPLAHIKEMERAIRENGGLVELHVIEDIGHFPEDTEAHVDTNTRVVNFLERLRSAKQSVRSHRLQRNGVRVPPRTQQITEIHTLTSVYCPVTIIVINCVNPAPSSAPPNLSRA